MCFHYAMSAKAQTLKNRFNANIDYDYEPIYHVNGFSNRKMPVVANEIPDAIQMFEWGLIPFWVKNIDQANDIKKKTLNARSESVFEKPSFKSSISINRCLIPATGFYEWRHIGKEKYPYFIKMKELAVFSFGGIWSKWIDKETGEIKNTFSIITTKSNDLMSIIHNKKKRMPLILTPENEYRWLANSLSKEEICNLMNPLENGLLNAHTIDQRISSPKYYSNIAETTNKVEYIGIDSNLG